ncbi:unnamed protein product, partial [Amoebophrya sp. A25]|eukprot:GSA25T00005726001.1
MAVSFEAMRELADGRSGDATGAGAPFSGGHWTGVLVTLFLDLITFAISFVIFLVTRRHRWDATPDLKNAGTSSVGRPTTQHAFSSSFRSTRGTRQTKTRPSFKDEDFYTSRPPRSRGLDAPELDHLMLSSRSGATPRTGGVSFGGRDSISVNELLLHRKRSVSREPRLEGLDRTSEDHRRTEERRAAPLLTEEERMTYKSDLDAASETYPRELSKGGMADDGEDSSGTSAESKRLAFSNRSIARSEMWDVVGADT